MRNLISALVVFVLSYSYSLAQLYDKNWTCGTPINVATFNDNQIDTFHFYPNIHCLNTLACISDSSGRFQFFTEGVNVYSYDGTLMVNGAGISDNEVNSHYYYGLPDCQNALILPKRNSEYYIINQSASDPMFNSQGFIHTNMLYYSVVDMDRQFGKGEVTVKRQAINSGYFMDGHMTACRHANGRDWWLVQRRYNTHGYFTYLVTADSITLQHEQFIGASSKEPDAVGQSAFSPDGSRYATITGTSPLIILDFDRCTGLFSNPLKVDIPKDTFMFYGQQKIMGGGGYGVCFSPNNQLIYVNSLYVLRQYDLRQPVIDSTETVLFFWTDSFELLGQFDQMHLAPNGKLYIANYQGFTYALHVINSPDSTGVACSFVKSGLPVATNAAAMIPNMVHFRIGALAGSACDTIQTGISPLAANSKIQPRIYPNPASSVVDIDLPDYNLYHPQQKFVLYDANGRLVKQVPLPYLNAQLNVSDLPVGTYYWQLTVNTSIRNSGMLDIIK